MARRIRKVREKIKKEIKKENRKTNWPIWILYTLLLISLILYVATKSPLFGILFVAVFVIIIIFELRDSISKEGLRKTAIELVFAIGAIVVVWLAIMFLLGTSSPIDVVPSCSMLPYLHVGDIVVLSGISNMSRFLFQHSSVPIINISISSFDSMLSSIGTEYLAFYAYVNGNRSAISYIVNGNATYSIGLYNTKCLSAYAYMGQKNNFYKCYVPDQSSNLVRYNYSIGNITIDGTNYKVVYTSGISVGNSTITENYSNPVIVYSTTANDTFSGSIVHRVVAALKVGNTYYLLTKGDNNPALDMEFGNYPPSSDHVVGYVLGSVPYIGYITLAFKGGISTSGCNQTIQR